MIIVSVHTDYNHWLFTQPFCTSRCFSYQVRALNFLVTATRLLGTVVPLYTIWETIPRWKHSLTQIANRIIHTLERAHQCSKVLKLSICLVQTYNCDCKLPSAIPTCSVAKKHEASHELANEALPEALFDTRCVV